AAAGSVPEVRVGAGHRGRCARARPCPDGPRPRRRDRGGVDRATEAGTPPVATFNQRAGRRALHRPAPPVNPIRKSPATRRSQFGGILPPVGRPEVPMNRGIVVLPLTHSLASSAPAAPGDPHLVQGTLEWPAKLTVEPFVVVRGEDGRWYYAELKAAKR